MNICDGILEVIFPVVEWGSMYLGYAQLSYVRNNTIYTPAALLYRAWRLLSILQPTLAICSATIFTLIANY